MKEWSYVKHRKLTWVGILLDLAFIVIFFSSFMWILVKRWDSSNAKGYGMILMLLIWIISLAKLSQMLIKDVIRKLDKGNATGTEDVDYNHEHGDVENNEDVILYMSIKKE